MHSSGSRSELFGDDQPRFAGWASDVVSCSHHAGFSSHWAESKLAVDSKVTREVGSLRLWFDSFWAVPQKAYFECPVQSRLRGANDGRPSLQTPYVQ